MLKKESIIFKTVQIFSFPITLNLSKYDFQDIKYQFIHENKQKLAFFEPM